MLGCSFDPQGQPFEANNADQLACVKVFSTAGTPAFAMDVDMATGSFPIQDPP